MTQTSESYPAPASPSSAASADSASEHNTSPAIPVPPNTLTRMVTALVVLPFVIYAWLAGGLAFTLVIGGAFMVATLEEVTIMRGGQVGLTTWAAVGLALADLVALITGQPLLWMFSTVIGSLVIFALEFAVGRRDFPRMVLMVLLTVGLALVGGMAILIRNQVPGIFWWLLIFVGTWGTDTLAFAGGHAYGKTPLLPSWSPKKTVEGTLTGVVGAIGIGVFILAYFKLVAPLTLLIVGLTPFAAVIGDLLESRFKRYYHVKDSSVKGFNVMPGHGGVLDRIDSLIAVIIVVYLVLWLVV